MQPRLIVHGGAWDIPDEHVDDHVAGVHKAVKTVAPLLEQGMSALEAVEKAVNVLEEDPTFDAGRGAFLNAEGGIELDAMIMDGSTLDFGCIAAMRNLLNPVSVARKVMDSPDFRFLVGEGAMRFAREHGFSELPFEELLTERELSFYNKIRNNPEFNQIGAFSGKTPSDTVGAVALDEQGNLACATSTGGTPRKHPGRVGDSPVIGSGGYADNDTAAASSTGYGETIMRVVLCKTACDLTPQNGPMDAAAQSINILKQKGRGYGGLIMIAPDGRYGFAHNTPRMAFAYADGEDVVAKICS
ncbi:isoaspartyl peptidase/L-asparaginase family protein [Salidesulfovibrio brasiliensis]